jgi:GNAT superfamily N-acetyltransferase
MRSGRKRTPVPGRGRSPFARIRRKSGARHPTAIEFDSDDVQALVIAQQAELRGADGRGDIGPVREAWMFAEPHGVFLVVRDEDGRALACGGITRFDADRAELKRMYVVPEARGQGLGRRLLGALEDEARRRGYRGVVLETGVVHEAALALYRGAGYAPTPCWGPYSASPISCCFEKLLPPLEEP